MSKWFKSVAVLSVAVAAFGASQALAWGSHGHRLIGEEAMRALPSYLPSFLKTPQSIADVGEYSREPDRWRDAGFVHDSDRNSAHFIDLYDDGTTFAGTTMDNLPRTRADYDIAVVAGGKKPWHAGYLPYAQIDAYQQVVKDMAYWRVLHYLEGREKDAVKRGWYKADRIRREQLMLRDIGILSHYMGDSTNPMHLSIHYNGWDKDTANPQGFTSEKVHGPLESDFVSAHIKVADVRGNMAAPVTCSAKIEVCMADKIKRNFTQLVPVYELEKEGVFKADAPPELTAKGTVFMGKLLGAGAADLRDVVVDAWRESKTMKVGYPGATYDDIIAGKVPDIYSYLKD
jgi:hypothetical protein